MRPLSRGIVLAALLLLCSHSWADPYRISWLSPLQAGHKLLSETNEAEGGWGHAGSPRLGDDGLLWDVRTHARAIGDPEGVVAVFWGDTVERPFMVERVDPAAGAWARVQLQVSTRSEIKMDPPVGDTPEDYERWQNTVFQVFAHVVGNTTVPGTWILAGTLPGVDEYHQAWFQTREGLLPVDTLLWLKIRTDTKAHAFWDGATPRSSSVHVEVDAALVLVPEPASLILLLVTGVGLATVSSRDRGRYGLTATCRAL